MMGKQIFLDILAVLILPVLLIGGYHLWWKSDETALLSISPQTQSAQLDAPGAKTKKAKNALSISIDNSLFTSPSYMALQSYTFEIPSVPLSREYPFTSPKEILDLIKSARTNSSSGKGVTTSLSAKIETIKQSTISVKPK